MFESEAPALLTMGSLGLLSILFIDILVRQARAMLARPCRLIRAFFAPDTCAGACQPGSRCLAVRTRPYFFFWRQAADCACVRIPPGAGGGAGGAPGGGGAGETEGQ